MARIKNVKVIDLSGLNATDDGKGKVTLSLGSTAGEAIAVNEGGTGTDTHTSNAVLTGNGTSAIGSSSNLTYSSDTLTLQSNADNDVPIFAIKNTHNDDHCGKLQFIKDGSDPGSGDDIAKIEFISEDAGSSSHQYGSIFSTIGNATHGQETGAMYLKIATRGGSELAGLSLTSEASGIVNATIGNGTTSEVTVPGTLVLEDGANDATGPLFKIINNRGSNNGVDGDDCGTIGFYANDDAQNSQAFAEIFAEVGTAATNDEKGNLELKVATENSGVLVTGLKLEGTNVSNKVDATIGAGTSSVTTIAGDLKITGNDIKASDGTTSITTDGADVTVAGDLTANSLTGTLAQSNIANSTSSTLGIGEINIGHADDTTLNRKSAGVLQIEKVGSAKEIVTWDASSSTHQDMTLDSASAAKPVIEIKNTHNGATSGELKFNNTHGGNAGEDGDDLGRITFYGNDNAGTPNNQQFAEILGEIEERDSGNEGGKLSFKVAAHDGDLHDGLVIEDGDDDSEIDVTIGNGASSVTTTAGNLTTTGSITVGSNIIKASDGDSTITMDTSSNVTIAGNLTVQGSMLRVGSGANLWNAGSEGHNNYMYFLPTDFSSAVESINHMRTPSDQFFLPVIDATTSAKYELKGGDGTLGGTFNNDIAQTWVGMKMIPRGYKATGAQVWATKGGTSQPTFEVLYQSLGNGSPANSYSSAQNTVAINTSVSSISFDNNGEAGDGNNVRSVYSGFPTFIIIRVNKLHADDVLFGAAVAITADSGS